jgi:hypothetical protein
VSAGWKHSLAVGAAGRLWAWGWGGSQGSATAAFPGQASAGGQLGLGHEFDVHAPMPLTLLGHARRALEQARGGLRPE